MKNLVYLLLFFLFLASCGGNVEINPDILSSDDLSPQPVGLAALNVSPGPNGCSKAIPINEIHVLDGTTFPFACDVTKNTEFKAPMPLKLEGCMREQFFQLTETFDPGWRNRKRYCANYPNCPTTNYPYYPQTRVYYYEVNPSKYWYIATEYAVDEWLAPSGHVIYYVATDANGVPIRAFHPGEDWNLSINGGSPDEGEHVYAIGKGVVIFRGTGFGNTLQILHKVCPNRVEGPSCELFVSSYSHLSNTNWDQAPTVGTVVEKGQVIAKVGDVGAEGMPHLHLEVRRDAFLQKIDNNCQPANGPYVQLNPNLQLPDGRTCGVGCWPRLEVDFIRKNYEDPTEFIKENTGIRLLHEHHQMGTPQNLQSVRTIDFPNKAGLVLFELSYPPGNPGPTEYDLKILNHGLNEERLSGNIRPLNGWRLGKRAVIWGERDRSLYANSRFDIQPIAISNPVDAPNTPFNLTVTLFPYEGNQLYGLRPVPSRPLFFDKTEVPFLDEANPKQAPWFREPIQRLYDYGNVGGYGVAAGQGCPEERGKFCPGNNINRVEFFTILMNAINAFYAGSKMPPGIQGDEWYAKALSTAVLWKILRLDEKIDGTAGTLVLDNSWKSGNLTRREAARYIARAFQINQQRGWLQGGDIYAGKSIPFPEISEKDPDFADIRSCYYNSVIAGYDKDSPCDPGRFCPDREIIRAEMAGMIYRGISHRLYSYFR